MIVDTDRGPTLAVVADLRMEPSKKYADGALKRIIRKANYKDLAGNKDFSDHEALEIAEKKVCLLYTSPSPRDRTRSRMPSSA